MPPMNAEEEAADIADIADEVLNLGGPLGAGKPVPAL
jgi:hypothetical protein